MTQNWDPDNLQTSADRGMVIIQRSLKYRVLSKSRPIGYMNLSLTKSTENEKNCKLTGTKIIGMIKTAVEKDLHFVIE